MNDWIASDASEKGFSILVSGGSDGGGSGAVGDRPVCLQHGTFSLNFPDADGMLAARHEVEVHPASQAWVRAQ